MSKKSFNKKTNSLQENLIFGQTHNGIECATMPNAQRACDRAWLSAKQIETWSKMSKTTLWRWLERLESVGRISTVSYLKQWSIAHEQGGSTPTTFYNLNVLNQLAMACIDNEKLNEVSKKFSDILSEIETTGSYKTKTDTLVHPHGYADALRALADEVEAFKELVKKGEAPDPVYKYYIKKDPVFPFFNI